MSRTLDKTAPKPETLTVILLDEISGKLSDLIELMESTIPDGKLVPIKLSLNKGEVRKVEYSRYAPKPFYSCTIYNDGKGSICYGVNDYYDPNAILYAGETVKIDARRNNIKFFYFKAIDADATIRIVAMY